MSEDLWEKYNLRPADSSAPAAPVAAPDDMYAKYGLRPADAEVSPGATPAQPVASAEAPMSEEKQRYFSSPATRFAVGMGQSVAGAGQLWAHKGANAFEALFGPDNMVVRGGRKLGAEFDRGAQTLADMALMGRQATGLKPEAEVLKPSTWDVPAMAGDVLSPVNIAGGRLAGGLTSGGSFLSRAIGGAAQGGMYEATQPVTNKETEGGKKTYDEAKNERIIGGIAGGAVGGPLVGKAGDIIGPRLSEPVIDLLNRGVRLTPGQSLEGLYARAENLSRSTPVSGEMVRGMQKRATHDFNRAAYDETLSQIGERLPENFGTWRNAMDHLQGRVSSAYDNVHQRVNLWMDPNIYHDLYNIVASQNGTLNESELRQLANYLDLNVINRFRNNGYFLSGPEVQSMMSTIKGSVRDFMGEGGNARLGRAIDDARRIMDRHIENQNPVYAQRLQEVNRAYAMEKILEHAASNPEVGRHAGEFTPDQLAQAVAHSTTRRVRSRGEARLQELAENGQRIIPARTPDSSMLERGALMALLVGAGNHGLGPEAIGGIGGVAAAYNPVGQWLLRQAIAGGHQWRRPIGNAIRARGPYAGVPAMVNYLKSDREESD